MRNYDNIYSEEQYQPDGMPSESLGIGAFAKNIGLQDDFNPDNNIAWNGTGSFGKSNEWLKRAVVGLAVAVLALVVLVAVVSGDAAKDTAVVPPVPPAIKSDFGCKGAQVALGDLTSTAPATEDASQCQGIGSQNLTMDIDLRTDFSLYVWIGGVSTTAGDGTTAFGGAVHTSTGTGKCKRFGVSCGTPSADDDTLLLAIERKQEVPGHKIERRNAAAIISNISLCQHMLNETEDVSWSCSSNAQIGADWRDQDFKAGPGWTEQKQWTDEGGFMIPDDEGDVFCRLEYRVESDLKFCKVPFTGSAQGHEGDYAKFAGWVTIYILCITYCFIGLAIVCDECFVPSLNMLCEKLGISDDVAGATFMAAGASSPELFASLIGVLTNSAVGVGTVVGSELFNILVIVGCVCLISPGLQLDWRILARETVFFAFSLVLLIVVLWDSTVMLYESIMLMCGYVCYIVVCKYYKAIMARCCSNDPNASNSKKRALQEEFSPRVTNFEMEDKTLYEADGMVVQPRDSFNPSASPRSAHRQETLVGVPESFNGHEFGMDYQQALMHGFLYKKSEFYSKMRASAKKWQRRWCVLDDVNMRYIKKNGDDRLLLENPLSWASASVLRTTPTEFTIATGDNEIKFKAQNPVIARAWVTKLKARVTYFSSLSPEEIMRLTDQIDPTGSHEEGEHEEHEDMLSMPESAFGRLIHVLAFPLLVMLEVTIPNVDTGFRFFSGPCKSACHCSNWYPVTMAIAIVWLACLADGMMNFAETIGCLFGISEAIMGLTVGAAGTSLPNLFASVIVAKQGLGNMSVSNAFGSNTFNIFVALAFPWFVGNMKSTKPHYAYLVPAGKIFTSCLILGGVLALFLVVTIAGKFKLTAAMGYVYLVVYLGIIAYLCTA